MKIPLRLKLAETKTVAELEQMIRDIENDPDSQNNSDGIELLNKSARRKIDEISWAIYNITKKEKSNYIQKPAPLERIIN